MSEVFVADDDDRVPCDNEMCIGILGHDGTCGTCGRVGAVDTARGMRKGPATPRFDASSATDGQADEDAKSDSDSLADAEFSHAGAGADDPDERVPCADELCVGIVGEDGTCGTCGRRA